MSKRLGKEIAALHAALPEGVSGLEVDETNMFHWVATVAPNNPPYNKGAFEVELTFPEQYPFKPPQIRFKTPVYHPNVDEKDGKVCLAVVSSENWKPATKASQVIEELVRLLEDPEPDHPLRADVAEEYTKDRAKFNKKAEDHTKKFALKRK